MKKIFLIAILVLFPINVNAEVIIGNDNDEILSGTNNNDYIHGYGGIDYIYGLGGVDNLKGGDGNDAIYGGSGDDYIRGHNGNDYILGGTGNDSLFGDAGDDILTGEDGIDYFVFYQNEGIDCVTDFQHGIDKIVIYGFSGGYSDLVMTQETVNTITTTKVYADNVEIWFINFIKKNFSSNDFIFRD